MAGTDVCPPMLATDQAAPISLERMNQIMAQLSAPEQQRKLATDVSFLKQQAGLINSAAGHLQEAFSDDQACRQLLAKAPQMLRQLVVITAAVLQQLAAQGGSEVEVSRAAGLLTTSLAELLRVVRERPADTHTPSTPADTANLRMMHETGLLTAFTAAAQAATSFFADHPQLPRANPAMSAQQAALQLFDNPAHMFAAASHALLLLWHPVGRLMPAKELLSAHSLLQDTALSAATLAMALARAYAGDKVFCLTVMWAVLAAFCHFALAAASGAPDTYYSVLACQEVFELLVLGLAVGTGLLHAEYKGTSAQALLASLRTRDSTTTSRSSSSGSRGSGSKHVAVSAHHEELLQALIGVRQLPALHDFTAAEVAKQMGCNAVAVNRAFSMRYMDAYGTGAAASASSLSRTPPSAREAIRAGELVPWQLALPLLLTQTELLALAPPCYTEQLSLLQQLLSVINLNFGQLRVFTNMQHWQPGQQPSNWPSLEAVQSQMQLCVESVWLQLGPALLSLCRSSSGEAEEDEAKPCWAQNRAGEPLIASPRELFETFSQLLMSTLLLQANAVPNGHRRPTIDLAVVVEQNPLLACSLVEAALHAATAHSGASRNGAAAAAALGRLKHGSTTCFAATVAISILTDAVYNTLAARAAAAKHAAAPTAAGATTATAAEEGHHAAAAASVEAAAPHAHGSGRLEQKLLCVIVAALKYVQVSAALQGPATATLGSYYNAVGLVCVCSATAIKMLGNGSHLTLCNDTMPALAALPAAAAVSVQLRTNREEQLVWLHVLGRLLIAAGQLLQQVPQRVTASGSFVLADETFEEMKQFARYMQVMQALMLTATAFGMYGVLRQGEAAATAVAGGLPAAATQADLERLLQQATSLQQQVTTVQALFKQSFDCAVQGTDGRLTRVQALQQLHAACQEGGLPQQLCSFGVAYCAAFPQRGCCGNPACTNLDKFTETALASQGCSGCGKAVKFCSAACHKRAWKQGHKAACAILKQRQAAAQAPAAHEGV